MPYQGSDPSGRLRSAQDLKPENLLRDGAGRARIADFGVARMMRAREPQEQAERAELSFELERLRGALSSLAALPAAAAPGAEAAVAGGEADEEERAELSRRMSRARRLLERPSSLRLLESSEGSPAFRAPETFREGSHCGRAADVWSLGVTLFSMLTGTLPFQPPLRRSSGSSDEGGAGLRAVEAEQARCPSPPPLHSAAYHPS